MARFYVFLISVFWLIPSFGFAQVTTSALGGGPNLETLPAYPEPFSAAVVTLNNYAGDAAQNSIIWRVNGKEQPGARNNRELSFSTGNAGEAVTIEAVTALGRIQKVIFPHYVDVIVEPQTRVPAHFGGRALPSIGSTINATAITSSNVPAQNLVYTWRLNGAALSSGPVRGQQQISFTMPIGGGVLEVLIESDSGVVGSQNIELLSTSPFLHFYSNNSLYGLSTIPLGEKLSLVGNSATVRAEPYYLDIRTFNNPDIAEWGGEGAFSASRSSNPYEITVIRSGLPVGSSANFHVRNLTEVLQGAQGGFTIQ